MRAFQGPPRDRGGVGCVGPTHARNSTLCSLLAAICLLLSAVYWLLAAGAAYIGHPPRETRRAARTLIE